jgi:hypothetical protein
VVSVYSKCDSLLLNAYFVETGTCSTLLLLKAEERTADTIIRGLCLFRGDLAYSDTAKGKTLLLLEQDVSEHKFTVTADSATVDSLKIDVTKG